MTAQQCSRGRVAVFRVGISAVALLLVLVVRERTMATTVFAQAYGTSCQTQMPMLNAFGHEILDDDGAAVLAEGNGAGGRLPNIDAGVHNYGPDSFGGRWGAKFENATGMSPFGDAYDYSLGADRPSQWRLADAEPAKPFEVGSPPFRCEYATATDSNSRSFSPGVASDPMPPAVSTLSSWRIGSARQMVEREHHHGTVDFTYYQTNEALGEIGVTRVIPLTGLQTGGGPGFSYAINSYTRFSTTVYLENQRPALSILMQFKPSLWSRLK